MEKEGKSKAQIWMSRIKKTLLFLFFAPNGLNLIVAIWFKNFLNSIGITFTPHLIGMIGKAVVGYAIWKVYRKL